MTTTKIDYWCSDRRRDASLCWCRDNGDSGNTDNYCDDYTDDGSGARNTQ